MSNVLFAVLYALNSSKHVIRFAFFEWHGNKKQRRFFANAISGRYRFSCGMKVPMLKQCIRKFMYWKCSRSYCPIRISTCPRRKSLLRGLIIIKQTTIMIRAVFQHVPMYSQMRKTNRTWKNKFHWYRPGGQKRSGKPTDYLPDEAEEFGKLFGGTHQ